MRKFLCTLRVCGRKNYRLQDIQLLKITGASALGLRASSVARGAPMPHSAPSPVVVAVTHLLGSSDDLIAPSRRHPSATSSEPGVLGPQANPRGLNGLA